MDDPIVVTLLANAGLLLQYRGCTLLLDALQESENVPFSGLPREIWYEILSGDTHFSQVDALLFTHLHPDHFSDDMTLQYLKQHSKPRIFLPEDSFAEGFEAIKEESYGRSVLLSHETDFKEYPVSPDITVRAFQTRHLGKKYDQVPHFCYLISFGKKNVLFSADIDYTIETLSQLDGIPLYGAFVNPLFFRALCANRFFKGKLCAEQLCVYHIPFEYDDQWGIRHTVQRDLVLWNRTGCAVALTDPLQKIAL